MDISGKNIIVTGGASGIGKGMCERFASLGAANVVVADRDLDGATAVAEAIGGAARICDVTDDASVAALVADTIADVGHIDFFFANAGVGAGGGVDVTDELWDLSWQVNVMGPAIAARHVIPHMESQGQGTFVVTASAAGLTTGPVSFNYAVSKHAAIGVAEWLAINHGPAITVQAICPTIVDTPMAADFGEVMFQALSVDDVVDSVVAGIEAGTFIIAPNEQPMAMFQAKASDWDGFLGNLQKMVASMKPGES
ncbi:MAG: SDR family oxidoreductase [Acidimicrobiales bacterium]|nr:SDR family oxidoreductase [Acidimicrobiales bacterium]